MKALLAEINQSVGVEGSMVITRDGIMVAAVLGPQISEDVLAALASALVITIKRALEPVGAGDAPEEMMLSASAGKLIFVDLGAAYLVVVTRPQIKLNSDLVAIRSVARKLKLRCSMGTAAALRG